jgi:hypothetical protein
MARRGRALVVGGFINGLGSGLRNSGLKDLLGSEGIAEMSSSSDWENRCSESDDCWLAKVSWDASVFWGSWKMTRWRRRGTEDSGSESSATAKRFSGSLRMVARNVLMLIREGILRIGSMWFDKANELNLG